jgi:hypothetical protein
MIEELLKSDPMYRWCAKKTENGVCPWGQLHPLGGTVASWREAAEGYTLIAQQTLLRVGNVKNAARAIASHTKPCGTTA